MPPAPGRKLHNWLKAYLQFTSFNETPDICHFVTGVSTVASVLKRRVWFDQRYFKWFPNFYILIVAPPGVVAKTTSINIGMDLAKEIEGVRLGPESVTWQQMVNILAESKEFVEATGQDGIPLIDKTLVPMSCVTFAIGEFGTFFSADDKMIIDVLTSLWDGKTGIWERSTKTQGSSSIENPWVNMIACTTPSWMTKNFPEYLIGGGLHSRMLFVYAEKKRKLEAYLDETMEAEDFAERREDLLHDLRIIGGLFGAFRLDPEARIWGKDWYHKHWDERPEHLSSDRYGGYIARKQTHIHKLAMVLSVARSNDLVLHKQDLISADKFVTSLEPDMAKIFKAIGASEEAKRRIEIEAFIRIRQQVTKEDLWREVMPIMSFREFEEAIGSMIQAKILKVIVQGTTPFYALTALANERSSSQSPPGTILPSSDGA